jgi:hypothetical protein
MGMREISNRVTAELEKGRSRGEIYQALWSSSPADSGKIACCIASVPAGDLRQSYIKYNALLCLLLAIYPILTIVSALPIDFSQPTIFLLIRTLLPFIFAYIVFRFHGGVFRLVTIWFLIELLETLLLTGAPDTAAILKLFALFFIVILSLTISRKVFPNLGVLGPKKDLSGNYLL